LRQEDGVAYGWVDDDFPSNLWIGRCVERGSVLLSPEGTTLTPQPML